MNEPNQLLAMMVVAGGLGYVFAIVMGCSERVSKMVGFLAMSATFFWASEGPTMTAAGLYLT